MTRALSSFVLLTGLLVAGVSFGHVGAVRECVSGVANRLSAHASELTCAARADAPAATTESEADGEPRRKARVDRRASAYPMYAREIDGRTVYSLREMPLSERVYVEAVKLSPPDENVTKSVLAKLGAPRIDVHAPIFKKAALNHVVDEALLRAIAHVESNYKSNARSRVGAKGIMQLMPATARQFRVRNPYSPEQSIVGGAKYLGKLMRRYDGDMRLAAAAYNAGPGNVRRYDGVPPFEETEQYVEKVSVMYEVYRKELANGRPARG